MRECICVGLGEGCFGNKHGKFGSPNAPQHISKNPEQPPLPSMAVCAAGARKIREQTQRQAGSPWPRQLQLLFDTCLGCWGLCLRVGKEGPERRSAPSPGSCPLGCCKLPLSALKPQAPAAGCGCLMSCQRRLQPHVPSCVDSKGYFKQRRWWETGSGPTPRNLASFKERGWEPDVLGGRQEAGRGSGAGSL